MNFQNVIKEDSVYKIPLKFLVDLGLVSSHVKFNTKFVFTLEKYLNKLLEMNLQKSTILFGVHAEIIFYSASYIQYKQIQLNNNDENISDSRTCAENSHKKTPYQKSYEINTGAQWLVVDLRGASKQSSVLCVSLVYDKSDQQNTVFDSYNIELASTKTKILTSENAANTYSVFNGVKFDTGDEHNKYVLYHQFVAYVCDGCSIALLTDYANDVVYPELPNQTNNFDSSDVV